MKIEIEKNVPLPPVVALPLNTMDVGDSFSFSPNESPDLAFMVMIQVNAIADRKFAARTIDGRIRVWRTK